MPGIKIGPSYDHRTCEAQARVSHWNINNVESGSMSHRRVSQWPQLTVLLQLFLLDDSGKVIAECEDDRKLGYYSPYDGCRLHIVDNDPNSVRFIIVLSVSR
jgi:hypothetical protein